ncbi:MAG: GntR family transcriptional regulator [Comamonadaceae bacterium]|nr:MAG: GntR family transcriptional regulator [Comamonadaceae bacterium]
MHVWHRSNWRRASQAGARASHSKHRHHKLSLQYYVRALVAPQCRCHFSGRSREQLVGLCCAVHRGEDRSGISELQEEYGIRSLNTVRAAQQRVAEEGLLEARQGVGAFVVAPNH